MDANSLKKPLIGEPCNGCGLCCQIRVCYNGAFVQGLVSKLGETVDGPCPAMVQRKDGSFGCGVYLHPKKYIKRPYPEAVLQRNFGHLIGAGTGCDELGMNEDADQEMKLMNMIDEIKNDPVWVKKTKIALKVIHDIK